MHQNDAVPVAIVGAGPTGALLSILLQRRGLAVDLYESRKDPRGAAVESGRSINLALADRGIHALKSAGVFDLVRSELLPMRGRMIHFDDGRTSLQLYGQRPNEVIYSISRHRLNQVLLNVAAQLPGVNVHFEHRFEGADFDEGMALIRDVARNRLLSIPMQPLLAADGAGSQMRRRLSTVEFIEALETDLEHGYKELSIPAGAAGDYRMAADALHIWPRGGFMLIALPNDDGSFTATLFLPKQGPGSFETLTEPAAVDRFLTRHFADARALMPDCLKEFAAHPTGFLGTVSANPWYHQDMTVLIGDAAHAMVPFHGQGMNCCLEDCLAFDACVGRNTSWESAFADFNALRKPNTDAIAAMALENYLEMRESVADPHFQLQQSLSLELEKRSPSRFIPRYSMVMFHHEIPYRAAFERGDVQRELLAELTAGGITSLADIDFSRAEQAIAARLPPLHTADAIEASASGDRESRN